MIIKLAALLYFLFLVFIVILADRGQLDRYISFYKTIPYGDTLGHFVLIGTFAFLANLVFRMKRLIILNRSILLGSVVVFTIVLLEELSQLLFAKYRTFSLLDLTADVAGILFFGWMARLIYRRIERPAQRSRAASVPGSGEVKQEKL